MKQLTETQLFKKIGPAHKREAKRHDAEFYNYGWGVTDIGIVSKTDKGILETTLNQDGSITHQWSTR